MSLTDLYQEIILDHGRKPRNFGEIENPTHTAQGYNPLCGDHVTLQITVHDGVVQEIRFSGSGCAISTASASMMTQLVKGKPVEAALKLFDRFHKSVVGTADGEADDLGELNCLSGVRQYPNRIKCATLPWHALKSALLQDPDPVTTE